MKKYVSILIAFASTTLLSNTIDLQLLDYFLPGYFNSNNIAIDYSVYIKTYANTRDKYLSNPIKYSDYIKTPPILDETMKCYRDVFTKNFRLECIFENGFDSKITECYVSNGHSTLAYFPTEDSASILDRSTSKIKPLFSDYLMYIRDIFSAPDELKKIYNILIGCIEERNSVTILSSSENSIDFEIEVLLKKYDNYTLYNVYKFCFNKKLNNWYPASIENNFRVKVNGSKIINLKGIFRAEYNNFKQLGDSLLFIPYKINITHYWPEGIMIDGNKERHLPQYKRAEEVIDVRDAYIINPSSIFNDHIKISRETLLYDEFLMKSFKIIDLDAYLR